ncbi:MAG: ferredoxin reductase family protein [Planctomycetota bacterium]|nr:ferredoxin reductase family protein [Planctomycetota bacterium]
MRAAATLIAYAGLALLALGAAAWPAAGAAPRPWVAEFALAAGFVAFGVLALEFALVARLHPLHEPFGSDALMLFHRHMGLAAVVFCALHVFGLVATELPLESLIPGRGSALLTTGVAAFGLLALLIVLSLARRRLPLSYEAWRTLHRWLALGLLAVLVGHVLLSKGHSTRTAVRIALAVQAGGALAVLLYYRFVRPARSARHPWRIRENRAEEGDVRTLVLEPVDGERMRFAPGQFLWISTRGPGGRDHPISIVSSAERTEIELAIKALGDWSRQRVPNLQPGELVTLDGPFGNFTPDACPAQAFVLVAGGIGVTPLLSMLRTLADRGDRRPVWLFYAARNRERAPFLPELERLKDRLALQTVLVFEEGDSEANVERGFVDAKLLLRHLPPDLARVHAFVCGPAPMMDALEHTLPAAGFEARYVHTERFDMV